MVEVKCCVCGQVSKLGDAAAGQPLKCIRCGELLKVPGEPSKLKTRAAAEALGIPESAIPKRAFKPVAVGPQPTRTDLLVDFARGIFWVAVVLSGIGFMFSFAMMLGASATREPIDAALTLMLICMASFSASVINLCVLDLRDRFCRQRISSANFEESDSPKKSA